ncbi:MAG: class I SAM-dependent methyltransferase [Betaproteobacteria bacterium]
MPGMKEWIENLFLHPDLLRMGHAQRAEDANLGLGWIYYGLARTLRPASVVVIGSWRGYVPIVLGKALTDNLEGGEVIFIDPSLVDDFWKDADAVKRWFASFGVTNVRHFNMTTQEFALTDAYCSLGNLGMVFVDGYHATEQVEFDYATFRGKLAPEGIMLFHDSRRVRPSNIYGADKVYMHGVRTFLDRLKLDSDLQVFDLPFGDGVTMVRHI